MVFIAFTIQIKAQSGDSKKWTTEQAVDFVACSIVGVSLSKDLKCTSLPTREQIEKGIPKDKSVTLKLFQQVEKTKLDKQIQNKGPQEITDYLSTGIFSGPSAIDEVRSFSTSSNRKPGEVVELRKNIKEELLANYIPVGAEEKEGSAIDQAANQSEGGKDTANQPLGDIDASAQDNTDESAANSWTDYVGWEFGVGLLVGFLFAGLGIFTLNVFRSRKKGTPQSGSDKVSPSNRESASFPAIKREGTMKGPLPSQNERKLLAENEELRKQLAEKERELQSLKSSIPTPEVSAGYVTPVIDFPQAEPVAVSPGSVRSLYFPAPTPDGLFDSRYASSSRIEGESLYVLRLISEVEAEVEFDNSRISVNKAKNSPEQILDPVCEGTRSPMNTILGIRMTAPGKARLEGDDWRVYEKVKLTYEY